jgi:hypothetical protein
MPKMCNHVSAVGQEKMLVFDIFELFDPRDVLLIISQVIGTFL